MADKKEVGSLENVKASASTDKRKRLGSAVDKNALAPSSSIETSEAKDQDDEAEEVPTEDKRVVGTKKERLCLGLILGIILFLLLALLAGIIISSFLLDQKIEILRQEMKEDMKRQVGLDPKIEILRQEMKEDMKNQVAKLESQNSDLQEQLMEAQHKESGVVYCRSLGYAPENYPLTDTKTVTFEVPYKTTPKVHLGLVGIGGHKEYRFDIKITLDKVDAKGFTMTCKTHDNTRVADSPQVRWLSLI